MTWDVTVATTLADSYLPTSSVTAAPDRCRHWDRSMNQLLTSFECWGAGSPLRSRISDSLPICFRGCQSLYSNTVQSSCTTAFHQAWTSGHQWNSFYFLTSAFKPRGLYYRGYKNNNSNNNNNPIYKVTYEELQGQSRLARIKVVVEKKCLQM